MDDWFHVTVKIITFVQLQITLQCHICMQDRIGNYVVQTARFHAPSDIVLAAVRKG